jgi:hypothetical protein
LNLPGIDGFHQLVKTICLVQLVKISEKTGSGEETQHWKQELEQMKSRFSTPNIGMPDYPYVNNINEQLEQIIL